MQYNLEKLFPVTKGILLRVVHHELIKHLLTDSRKLTGKPQATLFFAIKGDRQDGHKYIQELYEKGVINFIIEADIDITKYPAANIIRVNSTLMALQQICAFHRSHFHIPIVGITGSNGKTIVKEWLAQILEEDYKICKSPKSYNSQIGVPLSVWQLNSTHQLGIFEAGISQPGEMENLEKIIKPDIGIFTNIGSAHDQGFLNRKQKVVEKMQLFKNCHTLIYCRDHSEINDAAVAFHERIRDVSGKSERFNLFTWSTKNDADLFISAIEKINTGSKLTCNYFGKSFELLIPFIDSASTENAIHCLSLMLHLQVPIEKIAESLHRLTAVAMRLELKEANNNCAVINDSYSNDISSLAIALDFLSQQQQHQNKTVILSDILQSGKTEFELYEEVAHLLKLSSIKRFIGIGKALRRQEKLFSTLEAEKNFYESTEEFIQQFPVSQFNNETILLKGARVYAFEKISGLLEKRAHETVLEINLNALTHNLKTYQSLLKPETKVMAMVKAFSYGSGSFEIANTLQYNKVDYLAVAYADEGVELRNAGIHLPIMVMCPEQSSFDSIIKNKLEPEIYSLELLKQLAHLLNTYYSGSKMIPLSIHLELDTGMKRLGFVEAELGELFELLKQHENILKVESVFTHLAASEDELEDEFTHQQLEQFNHMVGMIKKTLPYEVVVHALNSSGVARFSKKYQYDMVRLGIGLYGYDGSGKKLPLQVVSTLKTTVLQVKEVNKNETVGYNRKGHLSKKGKIAVVGIGYADGLHRVLGNKKGSMLVNGKMANVVGSICMDMCMLDITQHGNVLPGDEVIVFGSELPIEKLADWEGTIPYEILTNISKRVKRVYFED